MNVNLAIASSTAIAAPAPWWAKVLVGLLLVIVGGMFAWSAHTKRISFGEVFTYYAYYLMMVLVVTGVCVMLWGLGVNFDW
jgi:hypothetical protein